MADTKWDKFLDKWEDDDEIRRVLLNHRDTLKGARDDDEKVQIALDLLRNEMKGWDKKKYDDLWREWGKSRSGAGFLYTPANIAGDFEFRDRTVGENEKISGLDEFRKQYWSLDRDGRELWKDQFERKHGRGSWENVKRVMRNDLKEQELRQVAKEREEIMEGRDGVGEWLASALLGLTAPRSKEAWKQGRDPRAGEIFGDVAENVAYAAMPVGAIGRGISKGIGKVLNKTASKTLGGAIAEFAAPAAIEVTDRAVGNTDAIEKEDILLGGLTNLGVNKGLGRSFVGLSGLLGKKVRTGGMPKPIRERLEGVKSTRERAEDLVEDARRTMNAAAVSDAEAYRDIVKNVQDLPSVDAQQEAINILRTAENADTKKASRVLEDLKEMSKDLDGEIAEHKAALADAEERKQGLLMTHEAGLDEFKDETVKGLAELIDMQRDKEIGEIEKLVKKQKQYGERIGQLEKAVKSSEVLEGLSSSIPLNERLETKFGLEFGDLRLLQPLESPLKKLEGDLGIPEGTLQRHPELLGLFGKEIKPTGRERALEAAIQWGVNRAGTDSDAQVATTVTQGLIDPKKLREGQYKKREERKDRRAADVLDMDGYTGDDLKYLKMISEKPSIVTYGLADEKENTAFKNWLMLRGHDILIDQDSPLARRTFAVQ